jgi:hypothetical protein
LSLVERGGGVRSNANVAREARVMTDEALQYEGKLDHFAEHAIVNHSAEEYVRDDIHTWLLAWTTKNGPRRCSVALREKGLPTDRWPNELMPKRKEPPLSPEEQKKRFEDAARRLSGAPPSREEFRELVARILLAKRQKSKSNRKWSQWRKTLASTWLGLLLELVVKKH